MVYAADHFVLGDVDFDGTPDPSAWKSLGFDLDNADTSDPANQPNCLLFGAPPQDRTQLLDGQGGIDNTFGALLSQGWNASAQQTSLATSGQWTLLIRVMGNDGSDGQVGVPGAAYVGAPLSAPPRFDGTDAWPPTTDSDPGGSPLAEWGAGYMVGSSFYVTEPMSIAFDMAGTSGRRARLPIRAMVVQLQFSTDLSHITRGVLSGIVSNSDFDTSMSTCLGAPADAMSYTDILTDRAVDPSERCDGVSIAIGFTATQVTLAAPRSGLASPNQCGDGG
ncbi:MAG: hypothetical protein ACRELB_02645 [Polyangiaceae bacterium]